MSFRFWRRVKIAPGVTLNLSKSGGSLSFGPRGAKFTIGPRGARATAGIPGTGLFYTTTFSNGRRRGSRKPAKPRALPDPPAGDGLTLGFFQRLVTPDTEEALVDGCRHLFKGDEDEALAHLRRALHLADGAFLAGFVALKKNLLVEAAEYLEKARDKHNQLGRFFKKYEIATRFDLAITPEVTAHIGPNLRGTLLGLAEVCQLQGRSRESLNCLQHLLRLEPADVVVRLSVAELLFEAGSGAPRLCQKIVRLSEGIKNETALHAALLLYKARALRALELPDAARVTVTEALRRKAGRPEGLLRALRYERALICERLGQHRRARIELEKLYAECPDYEDVAVRLGVG
ncbi:MAG: DUF4236 domain-containing protein [Candidatus Abyssobacteria bacterium SURF_5]|uniref:DUF4236 domain-containing protein n=1 Tax=Abyssobacteria bacterium (strain SURF_5) TaxID=2093360 RepID=A0A3A4NPX5_ABYX5|nr:MAG: DUF4236 domain-containing protein [Candidatus Abyssubacteria bacterium SURF_5]